MNVLFYVRMRIVYIHLPLLLLDAFSVDSFTFTIVSVGNIISTLI